MGNWRSLENVDTIVVHCAATPNGQPFTAEQIDSWHADRGFKRDLTIPLEAEPFTLHTEPPLGHIGYHYVIELDGTIRSGRPLNEIGAHAYGHNRFSVGICIVGTDAFTKRQWAALATLVDWLICERIAAPPVICGHRDLSPDVNGDGEVEPWEWVKTCPGFDVKEWAENKFVPLDKHILA
ncbi:N-acetylmuramoyl-L-alanine amidase [Oceanobacter mangrovi]|uniref:N-acetylmuramoyl-L-alanine amidase n=1 Tax=Oceanobacter mangrovi TaxID=2862510 RepID=UPI001C8E08A5|nr:N-acetylmuramoyl-L-alanine amidase [Oceanobacter mangrovi]